jgi:hypothetical protein
VYPTGSYYFEPEWCVTPFELVNIFHLVPIDPLNLVGSLYKKRPCETHMPIQFRCSKFSHVSLFHGEVMYGSFTMTYSVIIMAIGASRIYRGLTDHPALNRYSAKEVASIEWSKELAGKPMASHRCCLTDGTCSAGGTVTNTPAVYDAWVGGGEI